MPYSSTKPLNLKVTDYYIKWNMLLLVTNIECQTSNVFNKTFEPTEHLDFKTHTQGLPTKTIYKTCEKRDLSTFRP